MKVKSYKEITPLAVFLEYQPLAFRVGCRVGHCFILVRLRKKRTVLAEVLAWPVHPKVELLCANALYLAMFNKKLGQNHWQMRLTNQRKHINRSALPNTGPRARSG